MSLHGRMAVVCLCVSLASSFSAWGGMLCFDRDAAFGTFCMCKKALCLEFGAFKTRKSCACHSLRHFVRKRCLELESRL